MLVSPRRITRFAPLGDELTVERGWGWDANVLLARDGSVDWCAPEPLRDDVPCMLRSCGCRASTFVWVSKRHRITWFEIPKNGSSSLAAVLGTRRGPLGRSLAPLAFGRRVSVSMPLGYRRDLTGEAERVMSAASGDRVLPLAPMSHGFGMFLGAPDDAARAFPDHLMFAVLRDPVERARSMWRMYRQQPFRRAQWKEMTGTDADRLTFERFLTVTDSIDNHHWQPQDAFLPSDRSTCELVRLADLDEFWPTVAGRLGGPNELGKVNPTSTRTTSR